MERGSVAAGENRKINDLDHVAGLAGGVVRRPHEQAGGPGQHRKHGTVLHRMGLDGPPGG